MKKRRISTKNIRSETERTYRPCPLAFSTSVRGAVAGLGLDVWRLGVCVGVGGRSNEKDKGW
jgi:hypothetical protein